MEKISVNTEKFMLAMNFTMLIQRRVKVASPQLPLKSPFRWRDVD